MKALIICPTTSGIKLRFLSKSLGTSSLLLMRLCWRVEKSSHLVFSNAASTTNLHKILSLLLVVLGERVSVVPIHRISTYTANVL